MLGIYCRISVLKKGNDLSIEDQKKLGIAKAEELKISYEIYIDEGLSGTSEKIEDRPEFERFLGDISKKKITAVFAYDQSRFERNPKLRFIINDIFKEYNVDYYTEIDGLVDLHDPHKEFYGDLMSVINKYHVTMTKIKVKGALKRRVEKGKAHSILPYGYTKDKEGHLVVDPDESEIVKKIYDLSLSGIGTRSIAEKLNDDEIPTRYNKMGDGTLKTKNKYTNVITTTKKEDIKWSGNTIRNIITNTLYKGERNYGGDVYKVPNIISPVYWQKVNDNLKNNRNNTGKKVVHRYLLKGLLRCGKCGRNMYGRTRVNKHDNYYMCSSKRIKGENCGNRSINIDKLEALIWDRFFRGDDFIKRIKSEFNKGAEDLKHLLNNIKKQELKLEGLKKDKDRAIELVIKGTLSEEDVKTIINKNNRLIDEIEHKLKDLRKQHYSLENGNKIVNKYQDDFTKYTTETTFIQKKKIVNDFIEDIIVTYDDAIDSYNIEIKFKLPISPEVYTTYDNFKHVAADIDFIKPKTLGKNKFKIPKHIIVDGSLIQEELGGEDSVPYRDIGHGHFVRVYNTRVPYGNVDDWSEEEIEGFFEDNPDWYCKESGVSLWSKNEDDAGYQSIVKQYQKELKKNDSTPTIDSGTSDIVW